MEVHMVRLSFLLGVCILAFSKQKALAVDVKAFVCEYDRQHLTNVYCNLTKSRHRITYLNMGCTIINSLDKVTTQALQFQIQTALLRFVKNKYELFGPQIKQNVCELSKASTLDYFTKRIFSMLFRQLKNVKCPLTGNFMLNKYVFMLPMPRVLMPAADYKIHSLLTIEGKTLLVSNVSFTVTA